MKNYTIIASDFTDATNTRRTSVQVVDRATRAAVAGVDFEGDTPWRVYATATYRPATHRTRAALVRLASRMRARSIPVSFR